MLRSEHQLMRIGDAGQHGQGIIAATIAGFDIGIETVTDGEACFLGHWFGTIMRGKQSGFVIHGGFRLACGTKPVPHQWVVDGSGH